MKTSIARIRLYLKVGKVLSDGTSSIMLMCSFNGRKEVSTGCSCTIKYWDKKGECVKKGYPNWLMLNVMIKKMKDDAIAVMDEYERLGQPYTPEMVLSPRRSLSAVDGRLKCVIERYLAELQKENVNLLRIAQSVGKSPQTLHQYISLLGDVDLL